MPIATIPVAPFPNVPNLPGVPQIPRSFVAVLAALAPPTLEAQAPADVLFHATQSSPKWGVFDSGNRQIVSPDSVVDFHKRSEWRVANFPVQAGQFASYNKVAVPFEIAVRMTKGGSAIDRTNFLQQLDTLGPSLELVTILTPEQSYLNCNVTRVELTRRGAAGAFFIDAEVFFIQIQQVAAQYSSTTAASSTADATNASALPDQSQGIVQPQTPSPSTVMSATDVLTTGQ